MFKVIRKLRYIVQLCTLIMIMRRVRMNIMVSDVPIMCIAIYFTTTQISQKLLYKMHSIHEMVLHFHYNKNCEQVLHKLFIHKRTLRVNVLVLKLINWNINIFYIYKMKIRTFDIEGRRSMCIPLHSNSCKTALVLFELLYVKRQGHKLRGHLRLFFITVSLIWLIVYMKCCTVFIPFSTLCYSTRFIVIWTTHKY